VLPAVSCSRFTSQHASRHSYSLGQRLYLRGQISNKRKRLAKPTKSQHVDLPCTKTC